MNVVEDNVPERNRNGFRTTRSKVSIHGKIHNFIYPGRSVFFSRGVP